MTARRGTEVPSVLDQMERAGVTSTISAEIPHNLHLHLALIQSGYRLGLSPARFVARKEFIAT